jgi:hypothetical protein
VFGAYLLTKDIAIEHVSGHIHKFEFCIQNEKKLVLVFDFVICNFWFAIFRTWFMYSKLKIFGFWFLKPSFSVQIFLFLEFCFYIRTLLILVFAS